MAVVVHDGVRDVLLDILPALCRYGRAVHDITGLLIFDWESFPVKLLVKKFALLLQYIHTL